MLAFDDGTLISEARRRAIFAALVEAEDLGPSVWEARAAVAQRFGITVDHLRAIAAEGIIANWPPLESVAPDGVPFGVRPSCN
jgi:hypothetical protein